MSLRTSRWPAGVPCWADLTIPDVAAAKEFYGAVLSWGFEDTEDQYGGYAIATARGAGAAGIGPRPPGAAAAWTLYLASDDVDATASAVRDAGGRVLLEPGDVGPLGRMALAADPTGAPFGIWQAGEHIGAGVVNEPGALTWEDLRSPDPDAARAFYARVFGHRADPLPGAPPGYTTFHPPGDPVGDGVPLGGMGGMFEAEGEPAHWIVYFGAPDVDAAVAAAEQAGGTVLDPAADSPYGRMARLADPDGARFFVIQTNGADQPDRSG